VREYISSLPIDVEREAQRTLARLWPRVQTRLTGFDGTLRDEFLGRVQDNFLPLFAGLLELYGSHYDFLYHLEELLVECGQSWLARSPGLKALDQVRLTTPGWFQSEKMVGAVCYVDLLAGDLQGLRGRIPYFQEMGITYLHLMPLFAAPAENSDGGYAVSDYRQVDPALGTVDELRALADDLRAVGISLCLDFVFNHTSNEHAWAKAALAGDAEHQNFYFLFPDRQLPDAFEQNLREIFPDQRPGNFTWQPAIERWAWTTFNSFQWDLNYANPAVFRAMAGEMLFLANLGAEILRLDALAFVWKRLGTNCENLPEAHTLIRAFNSVCRIAAPSLLFKSEAIVHPDEVNRYIRLDECQLSYNPLLMALLWESLATRQVKLLNRSMARRFAIPDGTAWINYVRCHDDIGWTFDDGDAAAVGINGFDHRRFLNAFYMGRFAGSFASGLPFQENPKTGDARISGALASLAGLEATLASGDELQIELSIRRILLLHALIFSIGGVPLLYLGDELGMLNDYSFREVAGKAGDSRWVHRPATDWDRVEQRLDRSTVPGRIFHGLRHLIALRQQQPLLGPGQTRITPVRNEHIFSFQRGAGGKRLVVFANFSEFSQDIDADELSELSSRSWRDSITSAPVSPGDGLTLDAYQVLWLV